MAQEGDAVPCVAEDAPEDMRFCAACAKYMPKGRFESRGNLCYAHIWQRNGKKNRAKYLSNPWNKLARDMKGAARRNGLILNQPACPITTSEMIQIVKAFQTRVWADSDPSVPDEKVLDLRPVPIDPTKPMTRNNLAFVSSSKRRIALKAFQYSCNSGYQSLINPACLGHHQGGH